MPIVLASYHIQCTYSYLMLVPDYKHMYIICNIWLVAIHHISSYIALVVAKYLYGYIATSLNYRGSCTLEPELLLKLIATFGPI